MPVVDVKNLEGKKVGQSIWPTMCSRRKVNQHLLHETVRHHLAGQRAGTHKTKDKSEVSGVGQKALEAEGHGPRAHRLDPFAALAPWRHGSWPGAAQATTMRCRRKMILGALRSALSAKLAQQKLTIVEDWALESHKTKAFRQTLRKLDG